MPATSTISSSHKALIKSSLPSSAWKIITATQGRIYIANPDPHAWTYAGLEGAIVLAVDKMRGTLKFVLVDLKGTRGVLWTHELYEPFSYNQDRTFFHTFAGDDFLIGFNFADEGESGELYKKVQGRAKYAKTAIVKATSSSMATKKAKKGGSVKLDKSLISAPSNFTHVAHMGYTADSGFSSTNVDPSWAALLEQLGNMGVSRADIEKNEGFIKDFVGRRGGPSAAAGEKKKVKKTPPPAPSRAPTGARKQAPPPPAPRGARIAPPSVNSAPPPPPPPARGGAAAPPPPPPPPARGGISANVPPPPPPPPARGGAAPPAPPPPPARGGGGAPPPPPPPPAVAAAAVPAPQAGRANLLASIQGQSVAKLKRTEGVPPPAALAAAGTAAGLGAGAATMAASSSANDDDAGAAGGGDLASALAAALSARKDNMGDSDDDASDDDW